MTSPFKIPFNKACIIGKELEYISQAVIAGEIKGGGPFTDKCNTWIESTTKTKKSLLTTSCTAALEMSALLCNLKAGDEVIMPSYTFTSTANAFVLRGAVPVYGDIREDTLNLNEEKIEALITPKTKAICVVHYAGVACEMDTFVEIAKQHNLVLIEDAAQAVKSTYKGKALGSFGALGTFSFHETKNFSSGEGGALLINEMELIERAEYILEKGTNRSRFFRGEADKYNWRDVGSSYLPSEVVAAYLYAQLEEADKIQSRRLEIWERYHKAFIDLEKSEACRRPVVPELCEHNAHMYYLLLPNLQKRDELIQFLRTQGILAPFHFLPLHESPFGQQFYNVSSPLPMTEDLSHRLIRLPLYYDLSHSEQQSVIEHVCDFFKS